MTGQCPVHDLLKRPACPEIRRGLRAGGLALRNQNLIYGCTNIPDAASRTLCQAQLGRPYQQKAFLQDALQELLNPSLTRGGGIELKKDLRRMPQTQPLDQLMANESSRRVQPLECALGLVLGAIDFHKDARRFSVDRKQDLAHRRQSDARIAQLALDQRPNLIAQSIGHTLAAVLYITILHKNGLGEEAL